MAPSTLFSISLQYVARNIRLVESFIGFPEQVGQKIFHAVEKTGQLDLKTPTVTKEILSLFTSAYPDFVMSHVNIEGKHLLLADCLDHLMLFSRLKALNVSSCCLGDRHELLYHISTLRSLEVLLLRDSALTDEGIRKLTAPLRINKTGPLNLRILDLSENREVTVKSIKFLRVFSALQLLNLSSTAIEDLYVRHKVPELREFARSKLLTVKTAVTEEMEAKVMETMTVKNQGWACTTMDTWIQQICQQQQQHRARLQTVSTDSKAKARSFYGRKRKDRHPHTSVAESSCEKRMRQSSRVSLVLVSSALCPSFLPVDAPLPEVASRGRLISTPSPLAQVKTHSNARQKKPAFSTLEEVLQQLHQDS